jgi:hypothetical protein
MDIDTIFSHPFHKGNQQTTKEIGSWNIKPIKLFPFTEFIIDGD